MSLAVAVIELPGGLQRQQLGCAQLHRHVRELERHALELSDLLAELHPIDGPLLGEPERALGATQAVGRHLQARGTEPGVGDLETLVHLAQHRRPRHPAFAELQDAVVVAAMRDVAVAGPDLEARRALVDQESGHQPAFAARGLFLAGDREQDDEIRVIGMADEVLGAVDDEIRAALDRAGLHAAHIRSGPRLGDRQAFGSARRAPPEADSVRAARPRRPAGCSTDGPRSCNAGRSWCARAPSRTAPRSRCPGRRRRLPPAYWPRTGPHRSPWP